jgi:CRP-like cAMP-binding protein
VIDNILVNCMPDEIGQDLMGAGAPFSVETGSQVDSALLGGSHVFIITGGIGSKFLYNANGRISEIGMVGHEAMFPMSGLLNVSGTPHIVLAQVGPLAGRMLRAKDFHAILSGCAKSRELVSKYIYSFVTQIATNLMISEQNPVMARIARWLLMCHDRIEGDVINVTHDALAEMSFAHRPTVTRILSELRDRGLIETLRAQVRIRSRAGLVALTNGSYGEAARYYDDQICAFGKGLG